MSDCSKTPLESPTEGEWSEDGKKQERKESNVFYIGPGRSLPPATPGEDNSGETSAG